MAQPNFIHGRQTRALLAGVLLACSDGTGRGEGSPPDADPLDAPVSACGASEASVQTIGKLSAGRYALGAVLLPDGSALLAGGYDFQKGIQRTSEKFLPTENRLEGASPLLTARNFPA